MNRYEGERVQRGQRRRENEYSSGNDVEIKDHGGGIRRMMREGKGKPAVVPVCLGGPETG